MSERWKSLPVINRFLLVNQTSSLNTDHLKSPRFGSEGHILSASLEELTRSPLGHY